VTKGQHYLLPLEAIVEAMKNFPEIVSLQAQLSSVPNLTREACIAEVTVGQGRLHSCAITTPTGQYLLQQKEAYTIIQQYGDLEWSLHTTTPLPMQERPPPRQMSPPSSGKPSRCVPTLTPVQTRTLQHMHKNVFALVDGVKTVEHIARLLTKSPQEVQHILRDLQEMHLVTL